MNSVLLGPEAALVMIDVQNDFLPGGSLGVPNGDEIFPALNRTAYIFESRKLPIFATCDWHSKDHCSFTSQGGPWPAHCTAETYGAQFSAHLYLPPGVTIIRKATESSTDAYSGFESTSLHEQLQKAKTKTLFVGGLATDYCVLQTVKDALRLGYRCYVLTDAIRAVNVKPDDGGQAVHEMEKLGAKLITSELILSWEILNTYKNVTL